MPFFGYLEENVTLFENRNAHTIIMKHTILSKKLVITALLTLFIIPASNAQLLKRLQKSAERTVERKLEQKTEKETGKMMDSILEPGQKSPSPKSPKTNEPPQTTPQNPTPQDNNPSETTVQSPVNTNMSDDLEVYSKFDFVPGDKVLFFDDFSQDFIGDFPSQWNTNGSGEVVKINHAEGHWFELKSSYNTLYIPEFDNLPEDFTIEFDLLTLGLNDRTSTASYFSIFLSDNNALSRHSDNQIYSSISLYPRGMTAVNSINRFNKKTGNINSSVKVDIKNDLLNQPHFAIAVTKNRYRLWVNEKKILDIPKMVETPNLLKHLKFNVSGLKDEVERIFISNIRVADGGEDLRRKLLSEGKISTNGIHFDSGSARIKPQSMGIILQIAQVMQQDETLHLNIVGHTDADGNDDTNMKLSKERANAVKEALVTHYNILPNRFQTDGKGASQPVADNSSSDGKAQNRRVEFIKL